MSHATKPGNLERGWNDPPVFLYNGTLSQPQTTTAVQGKRQPLTKRVAFPLSSTAAATSSNAGELAQNLPPVGVAQIQPAAAGGNLVPLPICGNADDNIAPDRIVQLLPPSATTDPPQFTAPIIVPSMDSTAAAPIIMATNPVSGRSVASNHRPIVDPALLIPDFDDDEQMFHYVTSRLYRALSDCQTTVEARIIEDMKRKVDIFASMWRTSTISYPVKCTMAKLATAIHKRRCDVAHELQLQLMIDHISEVSRWMIGIKRLIQEVETVAQPMSPSSCCLDDLQSAPCLAPSDLTENQKQNPVQDLASGITSDTARCDDSLSPNLISVYGAECPQDTITTCDPRTAYTADTAVITSPPLLTDLDPIQNLLIVAPGRSAVVCNTLACPLESLDITQPFVPISPLSVDIGCDQHTDSLSNVSSESRPNMYSENAAHNDLLNLDTATHAADLST